MSREIKEWEDEIAAATLIIERRRVRVNEAARALASHLASGRPGLMARAEDAGWRLARARSDLARADARYGLLIDTGPVYLKTTKRADFRRYVHAVVLVSECAELRPAELPAALAYAAAARAAALGQACVIEQPPEGACPVERFAFVESVLDGCYK